jgi:hypothetical protein
MERPSVTSLHRRYDRLGPRPVTSPPDRSEPQPFVYRLWLARSEPLLLEVVVFIKHEARASSGALQSLCGKHQVGRLVHETPPSGQAQIVRSSAGLPRTTMRDPTEAFTINKWLEHATDTHRRPHSEEEAEASVRRSPVRCGDRKHEPSLFKGERRSP